MHLMKQLAPSERKLFLILCMALFIALNMFGLRAFLQARTAVLHSIAAAKSELASDRGWLDLAESLRPAMTWIATHPMPIMTPEDASAALLRFEREEAEKAGLKVTEENLLQGENSPQESTVSVSAKLSGPFEGVVRMLYALQTPTGWCTVRKLTLRSDAQPPNVIADLELQQYFHTGSPSQPVAH